MKVLGIIVARAGSTRVPGKSLIKIKEEPVLKHIIDISKNISGIDQICLSTTDLSNDDDLVNIAENEHIGFFRGDSEKVLDRIYYTAKYFNADVIVYIGGDCPLLDPLIVSKALSSFIELKCDYLNNYDNPTLPGGYDINIISFKSLEYAYNKAIAPSQRVHAFSYLTFHPDLFNIQQFYYHIPAIMNEIDVSTFHWSLDYMEDVEFIKKIYDKCYVKGEIMTFDKLFFSIKNDVLLNDLNRQQQKPKVSHAFFSSISIMNDLVNDITFLNNELKFEINQKKEFLSINNLLNEIYLITKKMTNK
jgi:spore coat polysaccharide biosynthesis protein SpsF